MRNIKIGIEFTVYLLLTWLSIFLYRGLSVRLIDLFKLEQYTFLIREKLIPLIILLVVFGIATSVLVIALKNFERKSAMLVGFIASLIAVMPGFIVLKEEYMIYLLGFVFYIIAVVYVAAHVIDEEESSPIHSFEIGWKYLRKVALITAVGVLVGSIIFISNNSDLYREEFSDVVADMASSQSFTLSKDQIRSMLELQQMNPQDFSMTKDDFSAIVDTMYKPMTADEYLTLARPDFNSLPPDEKQELREQISQYISSKEYLDSVEKMKEQKLDEIYDTYQQQMDSVSENTDYEMAVDQVYNRINSPEYKKSMSAVSRDFIQKNPLFDKIFTFFPVLMGFTIFSLLLMVELISSFFAGLIFMMHYLLYKKDEAWHRAIAY